MLNDASRGWAALIHRLCILCIVEGKRYVSSQLGCVSYEQQSLAWSIGYEIQSLVSMPQLLLLSSQDYHAPPSYIRRASYLMQCPPYHQHEQST